MPTRAVLSGAEPAQLAARHDNVFADVGNHKVYDDEIRSAYVAMLASIFSTSETEVMADRLMFGSDWYMLAIHPGHDEFLDQYEHHYRVAFGDPRTEAFLGGNAIRFLGFDQPTNQNNRRLRARYEAYAPDHMPDWLTGP